MKFLAKGVIVMQKNLYLYQGKDYWLIPYPNKKEIIMVNIQSRSHQKIQLPTKKAVDENYQCWLNNQEVRLPRSFLIKSKDYNKKMIKALESMGLKKQRKSDLKKYLFFHLFKDTYTISHIDEISESLIPTLDYNDIHKVLTYHLENHQSLNNYVIRKGVGLFENQDIEEIIV